MKIAKILKAAAVAALLGTTAMSGVSFAASVPDGTALNADQSFSYRVLDAIVTVDPQLVEDVDSSHVVRQLFEGLMNQDGDGNLTPGVATDFDVSEDKLVYTFHLRDSKWSNGEPVTAADFVFGWQRAVDPATASPYSWYVALAGVTGAQEIIDGTATPDTLGVKAIDDKTFEVTLTKPVPYFPIMLSHATLFPANKAVVDQFGAEWTKPGNIVSNGAYVLTENVSGERVAAKKNDQYWDAANTVISDVAFLTVNDENQGLTRYLAGELDVTDVPAGQYPTLKEQYPDQAFSNPTLCSYYYYINTSESAQAPLLDKRVRQALSYAIDRDVIINAVLKGGQIPGYNFTPAATAGFVMPDIAYSHLTQAERDAKAKELLAEAGVTADAPLNVEILYNTSEAHKQIATVITQMWKEKLGVNATLLNQEWATFLDTRKSQNFDVGRAGWCGDYNEASTFLDVLTQNSDQNDGKFVNDAYDALIDESQTSEDPNALYAQAEQILADEMPILPIYHYTRVLMMQPDVKGWAFQNVEDMWYAKDLYKVAE